jgi:hypothetical protein
MKKSSSSPSSSNPQKLSHITIGGTPVQLNYSSSNQPQSSSVGFSGSSSSSSGNHSIFISSRNNDNAPQLLANEIRNAKEYTESEALLEQRTKYIKFVRPCCFASFFIFSTSLLSVFQGEVG